MIYETPLATSDFDSVQYINMAIGTITGETVWQLVDNIKSWFQTENFDCAAEFTDGSGKVCGENAVPYLNAKVKLTFDKEMAAESFAGISVVDKSGNKSALDGAYVYETDASGAMTKSESTAPLGAVSYTHLDVYKRQPLSSLKRMATTRIAPARTYL